MMTFHLKLLGCLLSLFQVSFAQTCPTGFVESSSSTCMQLMYNSSGFDSVLEANAVCQRLGTYMARMLTQEDRSIINGMLQDLIDQNHLLNAYAFLGGSDIAEEGEFVWTNGISIDGSFWNTNEPNNYPIYGGEDCVIVGVTGKLNDIPCCHKWPNRNLVSVICEYDPMTPNQYAKDNVFYEKCRADSSTIRIQTSSEFIPSSDISVDATHSAIASRISTASIQVPFTGESISTTDVVENLSVSSPQESLSFIEEGIPTTDVVGYMSVSSSLESPSFIKENNSPSDAVGYLSVSSSQEFLSGEFMTPGQEESILLGMTENPGTTLVSSFSVIGNYPVVTSGLAKTNTEFTSPTQTIAQMHQTSKSHVFAIDDGQNNSSTVNAGHLFYGNVNIVGSTSLLNLETSLDFISITIEPRISSKSISVTPTQRPKVTVTHQYISYTMSSVNHSYRSVPLRPQLRLRCSNKNQTQYQTDIKINMIKVKRDETQRFKRKFSCAQDDRMSSLIIAVVSYLILLALYLFIVVTDLLKIRSIKGVRQIKRRNSKTQKER